MDLVAGVKSVFVITQHCTREGEPKLVQKCTYPLTGLAVVNRIYTDFAVIEVTPNGFRLVELTPGIDFDYVQERTGAPLLRTYVPISSPACPSFFVINVTSEPHTAWLPTSVPISRAQCPWREASARR